MFQDVMKSEESRLLYNQMCHFRQVWYAMVSVVIFISLADHSLLITQMSQLAQAHLAAKLYSWEVSCLCIPCSLSISLSGISTHSWSRSCRAGHCRRKASSVTASSEESTDAASAVGRAGTSPQAH